RLDAKANRENFLCEDCRLVTKPFAEDLQKSDPPAYANQITEENVARFDFSRPRPVVVAESRNARSRLLKLSPRSPGEEVQPICHFVVPSAREGGHVPLAPEHRGE